MGNPALTIENINRFVAAWYQALDFHIPIEQVYPLLAETDLSVKFPDGDIHDQASFKVANAALNWYRTAARQLHNLLPNRGRVAAPTLLLWGAQDIALDLSLTLGLERWVPNLTVRILPHASHWVQQDAPEQVNRYLLDFLRRDPPLSRPSSPVVSK